MTPDDGMTKEPTGGGAGSARAASGKLEREKLKDHPIKDFHSLLVLTSDRKLYQLPVESTGGYTQPLREITKTDEGYRKVLTIAGDGSPEASKVSLALLPIKDEPNSGFICCYLANAMQLNLERQEPRDTPSRISLLVARAAPNGEAHEGLVSRVDIDRNSRRLEGAALASTRRLLDDGCVLGEVQVGDELVPLVDMSVLRSMPGRFDAQPGLATLNLNGRAYAAGINSQGSAEPAPPVEVASSAIRELAERENPSPEAVIVQPEEGEKGEERAREKRAERRRGAQQSNIAIAIVPVGQVNVSGEDGAGLQRRDRPMILFNALRLNVTNVWTVAEWSDQDQVDPVTNEPPPNVPFKAFLPKRQSNRLFVAASRDEVYDVLLEEDIKTDWEFLRRNTEVWRLLRNGCVAGKVQADRQSFDLINLAAFGGTTVNERLEPKDVLASTWDFKWPAGKALRVRFAPLNAATTARYTPAVVQAVKARVASLARSWLLDIKGYKAVNLAFYEFVDWDQGEYDILVDLNDLPIDIPKSSSRDARTVKVPFSEIGSYAGRADRGQPTIYLGFPEGIKGEGRDELQPTTSVVDRYGWPELDGYFGSRTFAHIVLHEFGHALGLPHLHQSPDLSDPFVEEDQARDIIKQNLGLDLARREILEELKLRWSGRGAGESTDWYDVIGEYVASEEPKLSRADLQQMLDQERAALRAAGQIGRTEMAVVNWLARSSVMMGLPVRSVYDGRSFPIVDYRTELGPIDRAWIQQLYPL